MEQGRNIETTDKGRFLLELYRKAQSLPDKELYDYVLDNAVSMTQSKIGFFHSVSTDQKTLKLTTWNQETLKDCTANYVTHYPVDQAGNWVDCVRQKKPVIYNDYPSSPNQKGLPAGHTPVKRFLSVPILENGKVSIIFGVGNKEEPYTNDDAIQLEIIANELNRIIKQRCIEKELLESKEKYQSLFANMTDGFAYCQLLVDKEGKPYDFVCLEVNEAFERIINIKQEAVIGRRATELIPAILKVDPQLMEKLGKLAFTGIEQNYEFFFANLKRWFSISAYSPKKGYFAAIFQDITERKEGEQALLEVGEQLQAKLGTLLSPDIEIDDRDLSNIIEATSLQETMNYLFKVTHMGFALADLRGNILVGTGWQDICTRFHRINDETCKNCIESDTSLASGVNRGQIRLYKCKNNMWDVVTPLYIGDKHVGNVFFGQFFFDDEVPERGLFEAQAEKYNFDKEAYMAAFERIPRFGKKDIENLMIFYVKLAEILSNVSLANLKLAKSLNTQKELQYKLEEKAAEVEEYASQMEELAEERAKQLKDAERLSAIGATAGMVGHDIRNPLQAITNHLYLAQKRIGTYPESEVKQQIKQNIANIEENMLYINKIVADLQDFARPLNPTREQVDVKETIKDALTMVHTPENIRICFDLQTSLPKLFADYTMLKRVLVNLAQNAIQAMPRGGALTITATTRANAVEVAVKDTGEGIPQDIQAKLFTPLMTTKAKGQGFGLAVVKRLTEAMGGSVTFESHVGEGTTFTLNFPI